MRRPNTGRGRALRRLAVGGVAVAVLAGCYPQDEGNEPQPMKYETQSLDLNGDGNVDFLFRYQEVGTQDPTAAQSRKLDVEGVGANEVQFARPCGACPLAEGTMIDRSLGWTTYEATLASVSWTDDKGWDRQWSGPWAETPEGFLGLKLVIDGAVHYGWVRISVSADTGALALADSAWQPVPDTGIPAGKQP